MLSRFSSNFRRFRGDRINSVARVSLKCDLKLRESRVEAFWNNERSVNCSPSIGDCSRRFAEKVFPIDEIQRCLYLEKEYGKALPPRRRSKRRAILSTHRTIPRCAISRRSDISNCDAFEGSNVTENSSTRGTAGSIRVGQRRSRSRSLPLPAIRGRSRSRSRGATVSDSARRFGTRLRATAGVPSDRLLRAITPSRRVSRGKRARRAPASFPVYVRAGASAATGTERDDSRLGAAHAVHARLAPLRSVRV